MELGNSQVSVIQKYNSCMIIEILDTPIFWLCGFTHHDRPRNCCNCARIRKQFGLKLRVFESALKNYYSLQPRTSGALEAHGHVSK